MPPPGGPALEPRYYSKLGGAPWSFTTTPRLAVLLGLHYYSSPGGASELHCYTKPGGAPGAPLLLQAWWRSWSFTTTPCLAVLLEPHYYSKLSGAP